MHESEKKMDDVDLEVEDPKNCSDPTESPLTLFPIVENVIDNPEDYICHCMVKISEVLLSNPLYNETMISGHYTNMQQVVDCYQLDITAIRIKYFLLVFCTKYPLSGRQEYAYSHEKRLYVHEKEYADVNRIVKLFSVSNIVSVFVDKYADCHEYLFIKSMSGRFNNNLQYIAESVVKEYLRLFPLTATFFLYDDAHIDDCFVLLFLPGEDAAQEARNRLSEMWDWAISTYYQGNLGTPPLSCDAFINVQAKPDSYVELRRPVFESFTDDSVGCTEIVFDANTAKRDDQLIYCYSKNSKEVYLMTTAGQHAMHESSTTAVEHTDNHSIPSRCWLKEKDGFEIRYKPTDFRTMLTVRHPFQRNFFVLAMADVAIVKIIQPMLDTMTTPPVTAMLLPPGHEECPFMYDMTTCTVNIGDATDKQRHVTVTGFGHFPYVVDGEIAYEVLYCGECSSEGPPVVNGDAGSPCYLLTEQGQQVLHSIVKCCMVDSNMVFLTPINCALQQARKLTKDSSLFACGKPSTAAVKKTNGNEKLHTILPPPFNEDDLLTSRLLNEDNDDQDNGY